jgi:8-oxo-dGTP pyrophosphatase MutT (NUDIX family)
MHRLKIDQLELLLSQNLPGWEAQRMMSPVNSERYRLNNTSSKKAAVLALLYPNSDNNLDIVYIKRPSNNPNDRHGGQISFPGGQAEIQDRHAEDTALRETMEEIGIHKNQVKILGALSPLYVFVSNFLVQPYVGFTPQIPEFSVQQSEVDYVITESLQNLMHPQSIQSKDLLIRGMKMSNVPYYNVKGETLWGATAMITAELLCLIDKI